MTSTCCKTAVQTSTPEINHQAAHSIDSAVETVLIENYDDFSRYLMRRIGDQNAVEDVLQNFCVRVIRSQTELRNEKAVMGWLYKVLRSALIDHYRSAASRTRMEASYLLEKATLDEDYVQMESDENGCKCIETMLPTLRPDYEHVLRKVDLSNESRENVAKELGISSTNTRVRLHRARDALSKAMIAYCGPCCEVSTDDCTCS